ncbi:transposase domain-containing protein [Kitasatospora sp. NPDC093679]|uniref:transposase domain-containing protein n=1 Tax=Kitasatospora sp. NPDC093679 TaxID=3154983 RepID=UPI00342CF752
MVQGWVGSGGQERVSLAEVLAAVPQALVDEAVEVCGVADGGPGGGLPPYLTACLVMASCLLPEDGPEELAEKVIAALPQFGVRDAGWGPLTPSVIAEARERLGRDVLRETFYRVAEPVATPAPPAARFGGRRLTALHGFGFDVPDSAENAAEFGRADGDPSGSGAPRARVVAVVECGSRAVVDAEVGPWSRSGTATAAALLPSISTEWLLLADQDLYGFAAFGAAAQTGAAQCWRVSAQLSLPVLEVLSDGTYLSALVDPRLGGDLREEQLQVVRSGAKPDPAAAHVVRVVADGDPDRDGGRPVRLITTLTDPGTAPAADLTVAHRRRQPEALLPGATRALRSESPDLVHQEIWAHLLVQYAVNSLHCRASDPASDSTSAGAGTVPGPRI